MYKKLLNYTLTRLGTGTLGGKGGGALVLSTPAVSNGASFFLNFCGSGGGFEFDRNVSISI